jgi:Do/DeqQ family serine protease
MRRETPANREAIQLSFAPVVKRAAPAVVNVYVRGRVAVQQSAFADDPFFRRFFGDRYGLPAERMQNSLGSGVIVTPDGLVVTNTHVVKVGANAEIKVVLADRREFDAKVIMQDEKSDIAIMRLEGGDGRFPFLEYRDSDSIEVGDLVLAIGNPFGVGQTVTQGIVSAVARSEIGRSEAQVFIQTDAAINPGNSGGALVDMNGRLVGINTAIYSRSGGSHGIGFAIPANLVRLYATSAAAGKKVERPWIGARFDAVSRDVADALGIERAAGAIVTRVSPKGPAEQVGLRVQDVVVAADGTEVADARALLYRIATRAGSGPVRLDVIRAGRRFTLDVAVRSPPEPGRDDVRNLSGAHPFDGARVVNILPGIADELGLDDEEGVAVASVRTDSIAANIGFQAGDVVVQIMNQPVTSVVQLEQALRTRQRFWLVAIKRQGRVLQIQVPG